MDAAMYTDMAVGNDSVVVERGLALHKMIRLLTFSLAGDAYLDFMGNEFGHPEWVDFPREGNGWSYHFARRQWSLADNPDLRYAGLNAFDAAMQSLDTDFHLLTDHLIEQLALHEDTHQLVYRRGPLVFAFNFHPTESFADLRIPVPDKSDYRVVLSTDDRAFAGLGRSEGRNRLPAPERRPCTDATRACSSTCPAAARRYLIPVHASASPREISALARRQRI